MCNLESYPPVFGHHTGFSSSSSFPTHCHGRFIFISPYSSACKEWGVFRLHNHGIPPSLMTKVEVLFSLSFHSKQALLTNPFSYFWGSREWDAALCFNWLEGINVPLTPRIPCLRI
ncbi:hypothetical protein V6N13_002046 [Hibiscus sabdariffa]|uniref:Non-haem dioxygenase N-terminal domain-containing protein n=1 Tax=Hibiscus sabdariffa TaxID=183260 RepID=A0ABR2C1N8_9ROSI